MDLKIFVFLCLFGGVFSATWLKKISKKPAELAHKQGCYIEELKDVVPYGIDYTLPDECVRVSCGKRYIEYASCGVIDGDETCTKGLEDLTKPYPECCPQFVCDDDNQFSQNELFYL